MPGPEERVVIGQDNADIGHEQCSRWVDVRSGACWESEGSDSTTTVPLRRTRSVWTLEPSSYVQFLRSGPD